MGWGRAQNNPPVRIVNRETGVVEHEIDPEVLHYLDRKTVVIDYTNHRGERAERKVIPLSVWFGKTQYHRTAQWLLMAHDVEKRGRRDFAMKDIHSWSIYDPEGLL